MYEKNGLMVKLRNEMVITYIRSIQDRSVTEIVENALRRRLGIPEKGGYNRVVKRKKDRTNTKEFPVKVSDRYLIEYLTNLRRTHGVMNRYAVENAILDLISFKGCKK